MVISFALILEIEVRLRNIIFLLSPRAKPPASENVWSGTRGELKAEGLPDSLSPLPRHTIYQTLLPFDECASTGVKELFAADLTPPAPNCEVGLKLNIFFP